MQLLMPGKLFHRARRQLVLTLLTAAVLVGSSAAWTSMTTDVSGTDRVLAVLFAPGLAVPFALLAAVLQMPVVLLWRSIARRGHTRAYLRLSQSRLITRSRTWVWCTHSAAMQFACVVLGVLLTLWLGAPVLERVQDAEFKRILLLLLAALSLLGLAAAALLFTPDFYRATRWLDGKLRLPWPAPPVLRYTIVAGPLLVGIGVLLARDSDLLGIALAPLLLLVFVLLQGLLHLLVQGFARRIRQRIVWATWSATGLSALLAPLLLGSAPGAMQALGSDPLNGAILSYLHLATDFDGDGDASLYGGGDCAALNPDHHSAAIDVADNGLDEDCDGKDNTAGSRPAEAVSALTPKATFSGAYPAGKKRPYNVLWIVADALRPDHMSVYGYKRETTPYLSQFRRKLSVFEQAYVQATTTHLSIPSMLTGRSPLDMQWTLGGDKRRVQQSLEETSLAERLSAQGYETGAVVSGHIQRLGNMLQGFDQILRTRTKQAAPHTYFLAQTFLSRFLDSSTAEAKKAPFFLFVYFEDAHAPHKHRKLGEPKFGKDVADIYDSEIALVDRHIGQLLQTLSYDKELWQNTIVVITADHGEEFREHGNKGHGKNCHRETMHVPLLARLPDVRRRTVSSPVALIDVVPTILEMVGIAEPTELTGQSLLVPQLARNKLSPRLIPCVATKQGRSKAKPYFKLAVRTKSHLLVKHRTAKRVELFDLATDPSEKHNLSGESALAPIQEHLLRSLAATQGNLYNFRLK